MKDRQPTPGMEGRMRITPENGSPSFYAVISMADNPLDYGTPLSKETLLKDNTAKLYGKDESAVPDDIFKAAAYIVPIGSIFWIASETIPDNYLVCDGSSVAKADYQELYTVIGDTFGAGTDTTFQLPDLRAKFIRGAGTSNGYSATFGQTQEATAEAVYTVNAPFNYDKSESYTSGGFVDGGTGGNQFDKIKYYYRPYNIALTPIIKYCGG